MAQSSGFLRYCDEVLGFPAGSADMMAHYAADANLLRELEAVKAENERLKQKLLTEGTDNMRLRDSLAKTQKALAEEQDARKAAEKELAKGFDVDEADFCVCDYRPRRVCTVHPSRWKPADKTTSSSQKVTQ